MGLFVREFMRKWYEWDSRERCARNVTPPAEYSSEKVCRTLLERLARGEVVVPSVLKDCEARQLRDGTGKLKRRLDRAGIKLLKGPHGSKACEKYVAREDLEKVRALLGKNVDMEV